VTPDVAWLGRVHILGIGGAGMSGIARILMSQGVSVSGCDARESRRTTALRAVGATVEIGHSPTHLAAGVDTVIVSTAIPTDAPEVLEAIELGLPVLSRGTALAVLTSGYQTVAVAGTHGKTTTTSMLTVALQQIGVDPSFAIGSELNESGSNAHLGTGNEFVVEADESDGSFLLLPATVGIVTNVEPDHLNYWGTFDRIETAFLEFAVGIRDRGGFIVVCIDDPGGARLAVAAAAAGVDVQTYGLDESADVRIELREPGFDLVRRGVRVSGFELQVPGLHNVRNATAAFTAGLGLGFGATELRDGLATFTGTRRRFDFRGVADGVRVYDDYAHHPTEIEATLRAAREVVGQGRIIVAFQAHHYYRTAMFVNEFGAALGLADAAVVLEVFAPGEELIPGASGQSMAAAVPLPAEDVVFEPSWSAVAGELVARARPGDLVMTLGAGDIGLLAPEVLELLRRRASESVS